jgi:hypothetical protein
MPYGTINVDKVVDTSGGVLAPISSVFRNRIINGAMTIDQRNAGASVTPTDNSFTLDRWKFGVSQTSKLTVQQNAGSVTPPTGFRNYLGVTSSSAYSVGSGDYFNTQQPIEGFNTADLGWGTASASTVTLSFWVRSSLTGTFGGALANNAADRSYPFTYTISAANTWEQKSITVAGDTSGTWLSTNSIGIRVFLGLGVGSTYSGTAGAWAGAFYISATGATSVVGTNGATFYITGVQLEKGSTATSFDYRPYGTELALCQRYYQQTNSSGNYRVFGQFYNTTGGRVFCPAYVPFRSAPTITVTTLTGEAIGSGTSTFSGTASLVLGVDAVSFDLTGASPTRTAYQSLAFTGLLAMSAEL